MENKEFKKPEQEGSIVKKDEVIEEDLEFRAEELKRDLGAVKKVLGETAVHKRILEFEKIIKGEYSDFDQYYAYHALICSGAKGTISGETKFTKFDFPGEEVKKFIDQLENEILDKSKE
ncbi:hypothetical protein KJ586_02195 [Patescibacteria group bacterium]|nr:hypothetical protein [Patescibacteria group bacterium]